MSAPTNEQSLLLEIARCPVLEGYLRSGESAGDCASLINTQSPIDLQTHQAPEPWSGTLGAPIIFFGSNPSIDPLEEFPTLSWSDEDTVDFFEHRFGGGKRAWVNAKMQTLQTNGSRGDWVRYWSACRNRATEILGRPAFPGKDFAISEVVHCKSKKENADGRDVVNVAASACADRFLRTIVEASKAKFIFPMGAIALRQFSRIFDIDTAARTAGPIEIGSAPRMFIFLDHPAGAGSNKKVASLPQSDRQRIGEFLRQVL